MNIPPPLPDTEHSILVGVDWATTVRVPIDGLTCPGCGTPLHQCQDDRGVLTDHATRPTRSRHGGRIPAGPRRAKSKTRYNDGHCTWTADDLSVLAFRLATGTTAPADVKRAS